MPAPEPVVEVTADREAQIDRLMSKLFSVMGGGSSISTVVIDDVLADMDKVREESLVKVPILYRMNLEE
jgi:acid stress-induced BolA-like protein IbaG/YrbA